MAIALQSFDDSLPDARLRIGPPAFSDVRQLAQLFARTKKWWLAPLAVAALCCALMLGLSPSTPEKASGSGTIHSASLRLQGGEFAATPWLQ